MNQYKIQFESSNGRASMEEHQVYAIDCFVKAKLHKRDYGYW